METFFFAIFLGLYIGGLFLMFESIVEWIGRKYSKDVVRFLLGMVIVAGALYYISTLSL